MEQMMNNEVMENEVVNYNDGVIVETQVDMVEVDNCEYEMEEGRSGLGLLIGGLVTAGLVVGTAMVLKNPKVRMFRRDLAIKRAMKMNESMGLGFDEDEIIKIINAKFEISEETTEVEPEVNNEEEVVNED